MAEDATDQKQTRFRYDEVLQSLRHAYNSSADERDAKAKAPWKLEERSRFLSLLQSEGKRRLLEIGAGTGQDSVYFQDAGLDVVATDASPEMVERCRAKGLNAHVADFLSLPFGASSFDAVFAMNCLLHVPSADLPEVLAAVKSVLIPEGLFYIGVYGGEQSEGVASDDWHDPPRFFAFRGDDQIQESVRPYFDIVEFHVVRYEGLHFQSLTLRKAGEIE